MVEKAPFFIVGLVLVTLLVLTAPVPAIKGAPAAQEGSNPLHPRTESREDLPYLDLGPRQPESPGKATISQVPPWSKLVFQSFRDLDDWEVWVANGDGSGQFPLTDNEDPDIHPRLNRGASRVVFASNRDGDYEIMVTAIGGSGSTKLTHNTQDDVQPAWSPDGTKVAFQSYRDGQAEVYVMNADGSGQTRLTWHADYDGEPTWSPDGTRIAFTSRQTGGYRIWVMNADGSGKVQRSTQPYSENPAWSPDGRQIAYDSDGDGDGWQELWLMNADGTNQHMVYDPGSRTDAWARSWSPDGRYVAFTRISFIEYQGNWYWTEAYLYAWDSLSGGWVRLSNSGLDWRPDWQTTDSTPPTSQIHELPPVSPSPIRVIWSAVDSGPAGLSDIDFQVRDDAGGVWTDWNLNYWQYMANYNGIGGHTYYFRCRATDRAGNVEPWPPDYDAVTTVEAHPPQTAVNMLPAYSRGVIEVTWGGWDPGRSGIATYDLQMRDLSDGSWTDWLTDTTSTSTSFTGTPGRTYQFRSRARDRAQNLEDWPPDDGDTFTTFYTWAMSGTVRDNTNTPVAGATVTTTPQALALVSSDLDGAYQAHIVAAGDTVTATWGKNEYGTLPATTLPATQDLQFQAILPPSDNLVLNWGFETGSLGPGDWLASGVITPVVITAPRHTGDHSAKLGRLYSFAHVVNVSDSSLSSSDQQLAIDAGGNIHTVWRESYEQDHIFYARRSSDGNWSNPVSITGTSYRDASDPQLVVGGNGAVHVVWEDHLAYTESDIFYAVRSQDGTWSDPQNLSNSSVEARSPRIAMGPDGSLHIAWDQGARYFSRNVFYRTQSHEGIWSSAQNISNSSETAWGVELAVDETGDVHVVWHEWTSGLDIFYTTKSSDGTWAAPQNIANTPNNSENAQLFLGQDGTIHVAWDDLATGQREILYASRAPTGTWSSPQNISNNPGHSWYPQIASDKDGVIHVVWHDGSTGQGDVFHAMRSEDGIWSGLHNISDNPGSSGFPQLVIDMDGTVHVVWHDQTPGEAEILYTTRSGDGTWSAVHNFSESAGNSWRPRIALDKNGVVHVVWYDETPGQRDIYHGVPIPPVPTGKSSIAQAITIPGSMHTPVLSFLYQLAGASPTVGTGFSVQLENDVSATTVYSTTTNTSAWTHRWFDLAPWAGQTVTLTFSVHEVADYPTAWAYLDEITLGSAYPDPWVRKDSLTLAALPDEQVVFALTYGNRGGAPADSVQITDELPPELSFVAASPPPAATTPSLVWDAGDLPAGSGPFAILVTATMSSTAPMWSSLTNTASIDTASPELETANNSTQAEVFVGRRSYLPTIMKHH